MDTTIKIGRVHYGIFDGNFFTRKPSENYDVTVTDRHVLRLPTAELSNVFIEKPDGVKEYIFYNIVVPYRKRQA